VPVLLIDGKYLTQSLPIIEYLNETRDNGVNLIPSDPFNRQKSKTIAEIINSGIQPYQNINVLKRIGDEKKKEWLNHYLNKGLNSIEVILKETSGICCVGDKISIADLFLVPQYNACERYKIDLSKYKLINKIVANLNQIPEFKKAHAYRQIDTDDQYKSKNID
jgi:maleylacetoacetate isomerase